MAFLFGIHLGNKNYISFTCIIFLSEDDTEFWSATVSRISNRSANSEVKEYIQSTDTKISEWEPSIVAHIQENEEETNAWIRCKLSLIYEQVLPNHTVLLIHLLPPLSQLHFSVNSFLSLK